MEEINYEKIGFKSGLEIHQQLDTKKLFCNCLSVLRSNEPDLEIKRKLHLVQGETGKIDIAVKHQHSLNKEFIYQVYDSNCLVETDEEPPHNINKEALKIALQICILLNCKIIPISQIMRKTVIDGSNTSGFQRTVMIANNGYIETSQGKVRIKEVFLEEDSARLIEKTNEKTIFRLDRLGIPLIEIATQPDIKNAEHAKETALKIGEILRSCKVKRGIGTIRQDINISIKNSNRVELKGFQNPKIMIKTVEKEVKRQLKLLKEQKKNQSEVRNVLQDGSTEFLRPMPGASRMYPETDLPLLKISKKLIDEIKKDIPKLKSQVENELRKKGLSEEMIKLLFKQNKLLEFKELYNISKNPKLIAKILLIFPREISKHKKIEIQKVERLLEDHLPNILRLINEKKISESEIKHILEKIIQGISLKEAIKKEKTDILKIEEEIMNLIKEKPGLSNNAYMGLIMKKFKGHISGKEAIEIIKKFLK